jgi:hypothetical protein
MARFPNRNLDQTAVYWGTPTADGSGGFTYADPVEISCRWVDVNELITVSNGDQILSHSRVQVAQDVDEEGLLFLGDLDDLDSSQEASPETISTAFRIIRFDKTPLIKTNSDGVRHQRNARL